MLSPPRTAPPPAPPSAPARTRPPTLATPLTWAGGIGLLGAAVWLPGVIAFFRAFGPLFR